MKSKHCKVPQINCIPDSSSFLFLNVYTWNLNSPPHVAILFLMILERLSGTSDHYLLGDQYFTYRFCFSWIFLFVFPFLKWGVDVPPKDLHCNTHLECAIQKLYPPCQCKSNFVEAKIQLVDTSRVYLLNSRNLLYTVCHLENGPLLVRTTIQAAVIFGKDCEEIYLADKYWPLMKCVQNIPNEWMCANIVLIYHNFHHEKQLPKEGETSMIDSSCVAMFLTFGHSFDDW